MRNSTLTHSIQSISSNITEDQKADASTAKAKVAAEYRDTAVVRNRQKLQMIAHDMSGDQY